MKKQNTYFFLFAGVVLLSYCKTKSNTSTSTLPAAPTAPVNPGFFTETDVIRGKAFWSECSIEKLNVASTLYTNKCVTCHALIEPSSRDEERWRKIVPPMAKKAKLSAEEESMILNYVLTMREAKK